MLGADQVLVGTNRTRRAYNQRMRDLKGFREPLPVAGDRLVCLRNDRTKGLINGGLWRVEALGGVKKDFVKMTLRSEDEGARATVKVAVLKAFFEGTEGELSFPLRREFGRVRLWLRAHRPQGAGVAVGRCYAVRRKLRLSRAPGALALYRPDPGRAKADGRAVRAEVPWTAASRCG